MNKHIHGRFFRFEHKFWEICLDWAAKGEWSAFFDVSMRWTRRTDHAGFHFNLQIMRLSFEFEIYDHRHWDHINNDWLAPTYTELDEWL